MGLYERVMGFEDRRISAHNLLAALAELQRTRLTRAQVDTALELDANEQAELTTLISTFTGSIAVKLQRALEVHDVLLLAGDLRPPYTTVADVKARLGV